MTGTASTSTLPAPAAAVSPATRNRVVTDGKFFRVDGKKFYPKGITYGPFQDSADAPHFPSRSRVKADFELMRAMHANCLRVYYVPPPWFLDLAQEHDLKILVEYPWAKHTCFLDDQATRDAARQATRSTAESLAGHPAVFALTLVNEIPPDIARWYGHRRVEDFIEELVLIAKEADPHRLITFANFPPTEFLRPDGLDFVSFNVYLHDQQPFANYLDRLQSIAEGKPLVLTEFGLDSIREGEEHKARILSGHIETAFRAGAAGTFIFAFTDDWYTGGHQIDNWAFGLTDRDRVPRESYHAVARQYERAPYFPLPSIPRVSVVVASYNGGRTLPDCLDSLTRLNYPDYEVILVDDGSTDNTQALAQGYPSVRNIRHRNLGLSAARNTGIAAATGDVIAFTDSDCRADEDWLHYLILDLLRTKAASIGGHNFAPHEDNAIAACVAVSPGAPAHVLLDDRRAEHIPGCNMAFRVAALRGIGGFDRQFRVAGDDVDLCWRFHDAGLRIGFHAGAAVWHHRRRSLRGYWRQQVGYGKAEAMLERKWPAKYNVAGQPGWVGRIYGNGRMSLQSWRRSRIYHGTWGSALFQSLYEPAPNHVWSLARMPEWYLVIVLLAVMVALGELWPPMHQIWWLLLAAGVFPLVQAALAARRVVLEGWPRPLAERVLLRLSIGLLYAAQPLARLLGRVRSGLTPWRRRLVGHALPWPRVHKIWSESWLSPVAWMEVIEQPLEELGASVRRGGDFDRWDLDIRGGLFGSVRLRVLIEEHGAGKQLVRVLTWPRWPLFSVLAFLLPAAVTLGALRDDSWFAALLFGTAAICFLTATIVECSQATAALRATLREVKARSEEAPPPPDSMPRPASP